MQGVVREVDAVDRACAGYGDRRHVCQSVRRHIQVIDQLKTCECLWELSQLVSTQIQYP